MSSDDGRVAGGFFALGFFMLALCYVSRRVDQTRNARAHRVIEAQEAQGQGDSESSVDSAARRRLIESFIKFVPVEEIWAQKKQDSLNASNFRGGECTICFTSFQPKDIVSKSPNPQCEHYFHKKCILSWLMKHNTCPNCRADYIAEEGDVWMGHDDINIILTDVDIEEQQTRDHNNETHM